MTCWGLSLCSGALRKSIVVLGILRVGVEEGRLGAGGPAWSSATSIQSCF